MFFEQTLAELNGAKIRYLLIGGVAVNLHGFSRATGDLDILISLNTNNLKKFVALMKKLKQKLQFLEEMNAFFLKATPKESVAAWKKLKAKGW